MSTIAIALTASGFTSLMSTMTTLITNVITWAGQFISFVTAEGHEIVLVFVLLPLVGLGVGILQRLFRLN